MCVFSRSIAGSIRTKVFMFVYEWLLSSDRLKVIYLVGVPEPEGRFTISTLVFGVILYTRVYI